VLIKLRYLVLKRDDKINNVNLLKLPRFIDDNFQGEHRLVTARLLMTDPEFARKCLFGPCSSYQFRIHGPDAWDGARDAIFGMVDRTFYPISGRKQVCAGPTKWNSFEKRFWIMVFGIAVVLAYFIKRFIGV